MTTGPIKTSEPEKVSWFTRVFEDYFIVEIKHANGSKCTFHLKRLSKITNDYIKGVSLEGEKVEYKTHEPFDYYVRKVY